MRIRFIVALLFTSFFSHAETARILKIYIDADRTGARASGISIERGVRVALDEVGYSVAGYRLEIEIRDHRGNSRRSKFHLEEFLKDPDGLVVFCGLHSPPVLSNLDFINENKILVLDPWAAAGPITRSVDSKGQNWIFRLSLDDKKAGEVITRHAVEIEGFRKPALLLENTGWGKSNKKTMEEALRKRGLSHIGVFLFDWGVKQNGAREILNDIYASGADVIFFVGNSPEGITFFKAMSEREKANRLPIRSHWGITGGIFFEVLGADLLVNQIDLSFLQTSFSFINSPQTEFSEKVLERAKHLFDDVNNPEDIKAPNGFIHAYDLTKLLITVLKNLDHTGSIGIDKNLLRDGFENIESPVQGLIKVYERPFSTYSSHNDSGHEALGAEDFRMAKFKYDGSILILRESK